MHYSDPFAQAMVGFLVSVLHALQFAVILHCCTI